MATLTMLSHLSCLARRPVGAYPRPTVLAPVAFAPAIVAAAPKAPKASPATVAPVAVAVAPKVERALEPLALASPDVEPALEPLALCTPIALSSLAPAPVGCCEGYWAWDLSRRVTWDAWCMKHAAARDVERWAEQIRGCKPAPKVEPALEPAPVAPAPVEPAPVSSRVSSPRPPRAASRPRRAKIDPSSEHPAIARWHAVRGALAPIDALVSAPAYVFARERTEADDANAAKRDADDAAAKVGPVAVTRRRKGAPVDIDPRVATFGDVERLAAVCEALLGAAATIDALAKECGAYDDKLAAGGIAGVVATFRTAARAPDSTPLAGPKFSAGGMLGPKVRELLERLESEAEQAYGATTAIRATGETIDAGSTFYGVTLDALDLRAWVRSLPTSVRSVAFDRGDRRVAMRSSDLRAALDTAIRRGCTSVRFAEDGANPHGGPVAVLAWATDAGRGRLRFRTHSTLLGCSNKRARDGVGGDVALDVAGLARASLSSRAAA